MNYKDFTLGDWIGHISGVIEDETTLDGNEMRDLVEFLSTLEQESIDYKTQYENYLKKSEVVISQLRADRDRLQNAFDKIRAEITNHLQIMDICDVKKVNGVIVQSELVNRKVVLYDSVIQIIDKYKAESEE